MAEHMKAPWRIDAHTGTAIYSAAAPGDSAKVCDVRGWGFLTGRGRGALGLSSGDAMAIQDATARLIAAAPDLFDSLSEILAYDGGAANALDDPYVMERAHAALAEAHPSSSPPARAGHGSEGSS